MTMLHTIKCIHTAIWLVMASATFYILYAGITKTYNVLLFVSLFLITIETIILLINKWTCPLTPLARKHTSDTNDNFDIYLPNWLAKYNKMIFGSLFIIGLFLLVLHAVLA